MDDGERGGENGEMEIMRGCVSVCTDVILPWDISERHQPGYQCQIGHQEI